MESASTQLITRRMDLVAGLDVVVTVSGYQIVTTYWHIELFSGLGLKTV
jgi:hypothetical protein